ncbi:hypothetical protein HY495_03760 [Candidatus Woesearchaeota archaeon]|nr:hypothetical protein [Candidatus Woesearchaeota archaeon]
MYLATNESLQNIVDGLHPEPGDRIAAICGSGDQAFALAEYGARVFVVDKNLEQISFAEQRLHSLGTEKEEEIFFNRAYRGRVESLGFVARESNAYFSVEGRLERIRANRANIHFHHGDFFSYVCENAGAIGFTKIYASNAMDCQSQCFHCERSLDDLMTILPEGGLLYVASGFRFYAPPKQALQENFWGKEFNYLEVHQVSFPEEDGWDPIVFVKR